MLDGVKLKSFVDQCWGDSIVPALIDYIKIPNKSPAFDPDWVAHGFMEEAVSLLEGWARARLPKLPGATLEVVRLPGRTPVNSYRRARSARAEASGARGSMITVSGAGAFEASTPALAQMKPWWVTQISTPRAVRTTTAKSGYGF